MLKKIFNECRKRQPCSYIKFELKYVQKDKMSILKIFKAHSKDIGVVCEIYFCSIIESPQHIDRKSHFKHSIDYQIHHPRNWMRVAEKER